MEKETQVKLIHVKKRNDKEIKREATFPLIVAEKALNDSKVKAHLNWALPENSGFEFKNGSLVNKKAK